MEGVALYARVSSQQQADRELSIPAQLHELRTYAATQGFIVVREFVDQAESARSAERPAFRDMVEQARRKDRPFSAILVWKLNRFARNREDSAIYKALLRRHGVQLISITERIDDGPTGRLLEGIIEIVDEFYSLNLAEDVRRGMKENARLGYQNGKAPLGYTLTPVNTDSKRKERRLEIDPETAPIVRRIFALCMEGCGCREIARRLKAEGYTTPRGRMFSNSALSYVLHNEQYLGHTIWDRHAKQPGQRYRDAEEWVRIENTHPALIDLETFRRVQSLLRDRRPEMRPPAETGSQYLLSGLAYCGACGSRLDGHKGYGPGSGKDRAGGYVCQRRRLEGVAACDMPAVSRPRLEECITGYLGSLLSPEWLEEIVSQANELMEKARQESGQAQRVRALARRIEQKQAALDRLYGAIESGHVELADLGERIRQVRTELADLHQQRADRDAQETPGIAPLTIEEAREYAQNFGALLATGSTAQQKLILRHLIARIDVDRDTLRLSVQWGGQAVREVALSL